jgi:hypothetical protein
MANTIRIKRRSSGNAGAPASLKNAELAFNEVDQVLYYGKGADGSGNATSVIAIGGVGWDSVSDLSNYGELTAASQTWTGNNDFTGTVNITTLQLGGTSVTATAAELNVLNGITASTSELNILDGVTADYTELNVLDGITASTAELNILDGVTSTSSELNLVDGSVSATIVNSKAVIYGAAGEVNATTLQISGSSITATAAELNVLDGITASTAELNILDGVTADYTELNVLDGITASTAELNVLDGITSSTAELNILDGVTADSAELNLLDGASAGTVVNGKAVVYGASGAVNVTSLEIGGSAVTATAAELNVLDGITASTAELNILDGVTASAAELNVLDGITASTAELNILDGVTADSAELNLLDGATANTVVNSKAVVYGSAGEVAMSSFSTTGNGGVGGDLTVTGNLTVNGTTVTVNAETVEVEDKNIVLGKVATPTDATADGGGLTLKGATDKEFKWVDSTDAWTSSEHVALAAGKDLIMNGATSGKVTVVVPDVAGTNTITFPAETGTVVLSTTVCSAIGSCELDGGSF